MARLSIGIPVRNGARHLGPTLDALLAQTWGDFEVIVSDNASDDGTPELVAEYSRADSRVQLVRQPVNLGANGNFNAVARLATGELFKWAAHDDLCLPDYLRTCVQLLDASPEAVLAHTEPLLIDEHGRALAETETGFVQPDGVPVRRPDPTIRARGLTDAVPARRLTGVLLHTTWVFEVFGVMRSSVLRSTPLQERFYGTDKVVIAEMALRGPFAGSEERLWLRRCHSGTTTNLDLRTRATWSNPGRRPIPPSLQMLSGYARAIRRTPLSPRDRVACYGVLAKKAATMRAGTLVTELAETRAARRSTARTG